MKDHFVSSGGLAAILIVLSAATNGFGQASEIIPPTPNAMKMTDFYSQRPGMYTGTAKISISLYSIDFDGWELPLTLNYNATGIRTNEEASEVGLGWSLNATGIISRTIRGTDDLFPGSSTDGHEGYVYNDVPVTFSMGFDDRDPDGFPDDSSYYAHLVNDYPDTEPDIFNYNFFGYSGSFVLSQKVATNGTIGIVKITEDATKISFLESNKTFTIVTPDGYKGEFTVKEKSTSFSSSTPNGETERLMCCGQENIDVLQYQNTNSTFRTTTSWYLSKIASPRGQEITFTYDMNSDGSSPYLSDTKAFAELKDTESPQVCLQTIQEHVYLKKIFSDEIEVTFTMEDREDLRENTLFTPSTSGPDSPFPESQSLKRFNGVHIIGKDPVSTLNKTITFVQGYFNQQYQDRISNNNNENELQWLRSRLDRVLIDDQEYRFYYEPGANGVPNKLTTGIDHFGFYNGQDEVTLVLPPAPVNAAFVGGSDNLADSTLLEYYKQRWDRRVDFSYGKAGLLTKMKYPTGGYTVYEYEPHSYMVSTLGYFLEKPSTTSLDGSNPAGGARIKSIKEFDSNNNLVRSRSYQYILPSNESSGKLMTPLYNRYSKVIHDYDNEPWAITFLRRTHSSIPGNNTAEGKVVGYSRVEEVVYGSVTENYKSTYYFENRPNKVSRFNLIALGYPNLTGS